jgi:hypothetical protein
MNNHTARLSLVAAALLFVSVSAWAGALDEYYLRQFGETQAGQLQKALLAVGSEVPEAAQCGMPLKHGLRRDWNLLEQSTQKVLAKQLALPVLAGEATFRSLGGHFLIHYATSGSDAPPLADNNGNAVPDWVETVAATFENVYSYYGSQGYNTAPVLPKGTPYAIYLRDLAPQGYYGVTNSDVPAASSGYPNAYTSWMELDNNFTDAVYKPSTYSPQQSLQITAAHEYHHAIQYGYSFYFDIWYAEATSTWMEDELYDGVNQLYNYVPSWFLQSKLALDIPENISTGGGYGRWIFNRYLAESHGPAMIKSIWEKLAGLASPGGADIPMAPVIDAVLASSSGSSLGNDFFDFTKRVYRKDWTSHAAEIDKIHPYSPVATFSAYPVNSKSSQSPTVNLPHYSFAFYKFVPAAGMATLTLTIDKSVGMRTAVFRKSSGVISEITANGGGTSYTDSAFAGADEVVLLIANTTATDSQNANFSTDGSTTAVAEPTPASVTPLSPASSSSGGSSGCFIATAAYGSYLHPQVRLLRQFRDEYLMTSAPGRAFVALYYRYSPPLADFIAGHPLLRAVTRLLLTPFVIAVVHPLVFAATLLLLVGAIRATRPWRRRTVTFTAQQNHCHDTSSH